MKILITGALGHIGSKIIHNIRPGQFEEISLIDNLSTQRYASLFNLPKGVNFKFYEDDICTADLDKYFKNINVVIHLAAITDAESSFAKRELVRKVNYFGTKRIANACIKYKCKLIFPSTTSVYGKQTEVVDESCAKEDLKPQSPYAENKLEVEYLLKKLGQKEKLKFIILRLGTIFGPSIGMRFHTAVNKFCWQAVMGQPITVWRTAMYQCRPYLDLNDAVKAFDFIMKKNIYDCSIYNVVKINTTVYDIVKIISYSVSNLAIKYVNNKIMNQLSYCVSNDRFKNLGFKFSGDLRRGVQETISLLEGAR